MYNTCTEHIIFTYVEIFVSNITFSKFDLRDLYFNLATFAFQVILYTIFYNAVFTGGPYGIAGIAKPELFGFHFHSQGGFFILCNIFLLVSLLFFYVLRKMPIQRAMECVRDDDLEFRSLGKNPAYYKYTSLAIAATFSSLAGCLQVKNFLAEKIFFIFFWGSENFHM